MSANRTPISDASTYRQIGEYWDTHDLSAHDSSEVEMDVDIQSSVTYFAVENSLAERLRAFASDRGQTAESLLSEWLDEKTRR